MREMVGGCCVCSDDRGWSENPLVYCDGQSCTVAVHQACYGIVTVPTGPWYCRKCESQERSVKVKCELCPSKYGALKRTDNGGWAHVVCALYIPEVRFGNVTTMEPIQLQLIPTERFNKVCYICEEKGKAANATVGACMQCNKAGCKQQFHVTCAQSLGLLCEEAGNYLDNVKYCGYCQHHYSKLKKGGNVKTIPPYKPISSENHLSDSNSEKEVDGVSSKANSKRKTSSGSSSKGSSKTVSSTKSGSSTTTTTTPSNSAQPKTVHNNTNNINNNNNNSNSSSNNNNKSSDKTKVSSNSSSSSSSSSTTTSSKSAKIDDSAISTTETPLPIVDNKPDVKDSKEIDQKNDISSNGTNSTSNLNNNNNSSSKDIKSSKKRKTHSRTPTPVGLVLSEGVSVVTSTPNSVIESTLTTTASDKKTIGEVIDKPKKAKVETTQSILTNQPVVALTSISTIKSISHTSSSSSVVPSASIPTTSSTTTGNDVISDTTTATTSTTTTVTTHQSIIQSGPAHSVNSLVVSVPLTSTSLSPHTHIINNQTSVVTPTPNHHLESVIQSSNHHHHHHSILPSEMSNGGFLKNYDKHDAVTTEVDMELEVSPPIQDLPAMKRSHSVDKPEKTSGRGKKKLSNANGVISQLNTTIPITTTTTTMTTTTTTKRGGSNAGRTSQTATPSPTGGVFSNISQSQLKDSPPSSPSSECTTISQTTTASTSGRGRSKNRKSAPATVTATTTTATTPGSPKDTKDVKLFQNGVTAPHMLGNQLNPNSNMAQKMSDHLNSELEAHSIYNPSEAAVNMIGPQLHHRVIASARASSSGASSTASGGSGFSSMLSGSGGNIPQTLDQLLERQWEQGSQFLMEQAQHFDIASLLSCLHQLRAENLRLEEHVSSLLQRRDHLLAVNARLAIPLTGQPATPQSTHPHTVNNIHPAVGASHSDIAARTARHSLSSANYQHPVAGQVVENGLPAAEPAYHRSPAPTPQQQQPPPQLQQVPPQQPSPSMRHSPAAGAAYPPTGAMLRQNTEASGRAVATSRPQPYQLYQTPGTSSQQQMVIRRDSDMHYQTSKPS